MGRALDSRVIRWRERRYRFFFARRAIILKMPRFFFRRDNLILIFRDTAIYRRITAP